MQVPIAKNKENYIIYIYILASYSYIEYDCAWQIGVYTWPLHSAGAWEGSTEYKQYH